MTSSRWESSARRLFRRCVVCPDEQPSCPNCAEDETCLLMPEYCDACASTTCVSRSSVSAPNQTEAPSPGPSAAGPVAGGVVGGVVLIAVVTFLVWKFCVSKRRRQDNYDGWPDSQMGSEKDGGMGHFNVAKDHRASTHTVASVASTVLTRASNIIQIAYIPGVTNRSIHSNQDLVPPVPPIPAAAANGSGSSSPNIDSEERHFFTPNDLRQSTISNYTNNNRGSVASTVYRNDAPIVSPFPAQMAARGKATTVSVRSNKNSPNMSRSNTPPVPSIPGSVVSQNTLNTNSSIVGRVGQPRPVQITRKGSSHSPIFELDGSGSEASYSPYMTVPDRKFDNASPQFSHHSSTFDDQSSDDEAGRVDGRGAGRRLMGKSRRSEATTIHEEDLNSPAELSSYRNSVNADGLNHKKSPSLNQIIEEAALSASRDPVHGGLGSYESEQQANANPFSDRHAARTP